MANCDINVYIIAPENCFIRVKSDGAQLISYNTSTEVIIYSRLSAPVRYVTMRRTNS